MPAELRGRRLAIIDGAVLGDDAVAAEVLAPLRALRPRVRHRRARARPPRWCGCTSTRRGRRRPTPAARWSPGCPTPPSPPSSRPPARGSGTRLAVAELRQLGGALARPDPDGGALSSLDGAFLALGLGLAARTPTDWAQQRADAARFLAAVEPWATGRQYLPMLDERTDTRKALPAGGARPAVRRSARAADPGGLFLAPHHDARA